MRFFKAYLIVLLGFCFPLMAQIIKKPHIEVELIAETQSIKPGDSFWAALRFEIDAEWHIYWRNPGDSGLPTSIRWNLPKGFSASEIYWPYPKRIEYTSLANYGYEKEVFLLTKIKVEKEVSLSEVTLEATTEWLVCKENCIPGLALLRLTVPVKREVPLLEQRWKEKFQESKAKLPLESSDWRFEASFSNEEFILLLFPPAAFQGELEKITFFPFDSGIIDDAGAQRLKKSENGYELRMKRSIMLEKPEKITGILVCPSGWTAKKKALRVDIPVQ